MLQDLLSAASAGAKLRAFRGLSGLSQESLGAELGVDHNWVSMLEMGKASPSLELAVKIERMTGIRASEWLDDRKAAVA